MEENFEEDTPTHAESVRRPKRNRSLRVLPKVTNENWPANLGELIDWYTGEVAETTKAAEMRLQDASKVIDDYRRNKTTFAEAAKAIGDFHRKWSDAFPTIEMRDQVMDQGSGRS
jgi:hypothetical protein